jgi:uncharacterized protein (DUF1697 family)
MKTYIALLRGINVGGHRKLPMADLRTLLEGLKFKNSSTYIQSGNVVFQSEEIDSILLESKLEQAIEKQFGFEVSVIVIELNQYKKTATDNPFLKAKPAIEKLYITHFKTIPTPEGIEKLGEFDVGKDQYTIENQTAYLLYDEKVSVSKLTNNLLESKLKVVGSTRNWKTTLKLIEMGESIAQ